MDFTETVEHGISKVFTANKTLSYLTEDEIRMHIQRTLVP
jgi:hypothetical protein